jgi:hypothetical protein
MKTYKQESQPAEYSEIFDVKLQEQIEIIVQEIRSEADYDNDKNPEQTALKYLKSIFDCFEGTPYLVLASQEIAPKSKLRLKKTELWLKKRLKGCDIMNIEAHVDNDNTRIILIANLKNLSLEHYHSCILNWVFGCFMLVANNDNTNIPAVSSWITKDNNILAFDYGLVARNLCSIDNVAILRYFPAENGKHEIIAAIGKIIFIEHQIKNCLL